MNLKYINYLAVGACALFLANTEFAVAASKCKFGETQRDKIVNGMSYDRVVKILGCKEERSGSGEYTFYDWKSTVPRRPNDDPLTYPGISAGVRDNKLFMVTRY
ncbi:hypothetical protein LJR251_004405 [Rhizobium rhizogenes]|jgi:hypothetical protein|uniref:hypothetical protein n=1 Tax=Rhizobium rhizogenes TaxID=359 RepID=UPI000648DEC6|nr:hypothetical protein [Rhizobium rhizogenes]